MNIVVSAGAGLRRALTAGALALAATPALATERLQFIEGAPPTITVTELYVAEAAGFFAAEGLEVPVEFAPNGAVATQMVASGSGDIADVTMEAYISGFESGMRGKFIASRGDQNIYYLAVPHDSDIRTMEDLAGKKIGILSMGSQAIFYIKSMARAAGLDPEADMFLPVGFGDSAMAALRSGQVQALGLNKVFYASLLRGDNDFRYIFHPNVANVGNYGFFVSDRTLATRRDALVGYVRALIKADIFIRENPLAAIELYWRKHPETRPQVSAEEAARIGLRQMTFNPTPEGAADARRVERIVEASMTNLIDTLRAEGMMASGITAADLADYTIYDDALQGIDEAQVRELARNWK